MGCFAYAVGVGVPGCIFAWMVVPVAFLVVTDLKTTGVALLLPNQPKESVEAAISDVLPLKVGYVEGSCEELLKMGLRNFFPDEPNYTIERDPDGDQLACENPESDER
ncbi:MAG: hypothetical protein DCF25_14865 [Leptolyngbya foveolarum]|uniref:Excalibur calcium-binding domain-containing protein n=1 Tax=Leptolyngbya foveolarum TaxID=47253 RepID=A0A2W4VXH3_9CYAN|nr:MAG: hypothetical protein DCF25_14865 [Leptolyngbya foveolarum]